MQMIEGGLVMTVPLQTFARSFAEIRAGESPWIALGKMMHQFFGAYKAFRAELVRDPIEVPSEISADLFRWAVFCAASVEYLCHTYDLECPAWAMEERYRLSEPWYYHLAADLEEVQQELRETTPEEFARRNVYCGANPYRNKYEGGRRRKTA
jgi:hypothetical protein